MKPVCVPCRRFFRCRHVGYYFTEGMPNGKWPGLPGTLPRGAEADPYWQPYKLWVGDRYECEGCGAVILSGFSPRPVSVQHEDRFADLAKQFGADQLQVNDC